MELLSIGLAFMELQTLLKDGGEGQQGYLQSMTKQVFLLLLQLISLVTAFSAIGCITSISALELEKNWHTCLSAGHARLSSLLIDMIGESLLETSVLYDRQGCLSSLFQLLRTAKVQSSPPDVQGPVSCIRACQIPSASCRPHPSQSLPRCSETGKHSPVAGLLGVGQ